MASKASLGNEINFEESIRNYGNSIKTLGSFVEVVRKLPGMYIGNIGNEGYLGCIREIFQNAVDELVKRESPCKYVKVMFDERDQSFIVEDTGRGIPHGKFEEVYTQGHSSSNYEKQLGQYSSGVHGVGAGVALALSKTFVVDSYQLGKAKHMEFYDGIPWKDGEKDIPCPPGRQGSRVYMTPAMDVLGHVDLTCKDVFGLVFRILPLTNIGDRIDFIGTDANGKICIYEELVNNDGVATELILSSRAPLIIPIIFGDDNGTMKADVAFTYDSSDLTAMETVTSFSNFTPTMSGTHVSGFLDGLCWFFRTYMNKIYLGEKSKITIVNNDIKTGLRAVVAAAHLNPIFIGQAKSILNNAEMVGFVRDLTYKSLEAWSRTNSSDLQKLCKFFKDVAEIRMKSDDSKIKLSTKYTANSITKHPKKFIQPSGKKGLELIIVEGDSALGSARNSRDPYRQGIFPIRGKLPNAFTTSKTDFLSNQEVASIISLVSHGDPSNFGKNFNIDKVKWEKIIMMCDADADGSHINTLLLRLFLLYMPDVIAAGKLYRAVPPLYSIGNKNKKYFTNNVDFTMYLQGLFSSSNTLTRLDGAAFNKKEASVVFVKNMDYVYNTNFVANTYAIDPDLLESVLYKLSPCLDITKSVSRKHKKDNSNGIPFYDEYIMNNTNYAIGSKFDYKKFKSEIEKEFRFVKVKTEHDFIVIEGLVNSRYQYIIVNQKILKACSKLINTILGNNDLYFKLNGTITRLYGLMSAFESVTPSGLTRYKGLGEQNQSDLGESVLRPDSNRTLIQYTLESVKQEIEVIRAVDSNKAVLLRDIKVTRQDIE